jgi:hypothetical protein
MPTIAVIPDLPALLVVARYADGGALVLANAHEPWREVMNVARALLPRHERRALLAALVG